jgi:UDP-GlcNAc3NAcA epimerase
MKIITIVGARPQFIKAASVSRALRGMDGVREVLVHTGQHYDDNMSELFFRELDIPKPDYHLGVGSATPGAQTGKMLEKIDRVLLDERPDWVLVYGDTNSTLAGALAAAKLHFRIAHVEAGLRSYNKMMPEEINRVLTDHISDCLLAPTAAAVANLVREGIRPDYVHLVGDVMYDATLYYAAKAEAQSRVLSRLSRTPGTYILATIHRAENTDSPTRLRAIFKALGEISREWTVIMPLHPRTRNHLEADELISSPLRPLHLIEPVGYLDMMQLEKHAKLIVTDSGGVQKEAFFHGVPCVTLRYETEWMELVQSGWNQLVPPRSEKEVYLGILGVLEKGMPREKGQFYGDGCAAEAVVRALIQEHVARPVR